MVDPLPTLEVRSIGEPPCSTSRLIDQARAMGQVPQDRHDRPGGRPEFATGIEQIIVKTSLMTTSVATTDMSSGPLGETAPYPGREAELSSVRGTDEPELAEDDGLLGQTIGHYRLDELIGCGSMGRVYRGAHLQLHRTCAVKVMNPGLVAKQPQIRERFWAEARAVANLLHPHVVTIHNLGSDRGFHFIEMEYIPGGVSLREAVVRGGPLEPVSAATLVRHVALALEAAHASGLVHRDVKPANVLLNAQGQAKLADFGLVRRVSELERAGVPVAGTPTYMAPELFSGVPASHRSDIYAVGVMLYYLLSARLPFTSDQIARLIQMHRHEPVPEFRDLAPDVPDELSAIIQRCLAKRPEDRFESASELAAQLDRVIREFHDTECLIRESVEGTDCFIQGARDHYRVFFQLPENRLQEVYVEVTRAKSGERLLSVFSVCAPADPRHFEFALRLNDKLNYGSLCVRDVNGQPMFVMSRTFSRDNVCPADVRAALLEVARRSDRVEQMLTDGDVY
jgi:serine/threonine-protein kinase